MAFADKQGTLRVDHASAVLGTPMMAVTQPATPPVVEDESHYYPILWGIEQIREDVRALRQEVRAMREELARPRGWAAFVAWVRGWFRS